MLKWVTRACIPVAGMFVFVAAKRLIYGPEVVSTGTAITYLAIAMVLLFIGIKSENRQAN
ncbi:hypothetical protein [Serratia plymuthica]|uniref:Uncharacterized protein n=1 Tax=Serratia plymuthica TaxID=82996 RepID=A0A318P2Y8_SERPL|nr:hypothetical protein [Serratia plymuthica]PYD36543.1 hypothetical protein CT690_23650 [Serratia plymuthica]